jgi:hypothetical protein
MTELAMTTDYVRDLPDNSTVALSVISKTVGWSRELQAYAVKTGAVEVADIPPAGRRGWHVTKDEALRILAAAALAVALGASLITVLRNGGR